MTNTKEFIGTLALPDSVKLAFQKVAEETEKLPEHAHKADSLSLLRQAAKSASVVWSAELAK